MPLVDIDEYRPGPYVATFEPSGSRRFMAPEERRIWTRTGATPTSDR